MRERQEGLLVVHEGERGLVCSGESKRWREGGVSEREAAGGDEPALGPEGLREREVARVAVDGPWREADRRPGRDVSIHEQVSVPC